jgi:Cu(I)/Ag(I) efflux system membrane fusion protein
VMTGIVGNKYTEIIRGISEHEQVVERGLFLLDSESSKESDFKRMSHPLDLPTATVNGLIKRIDFDTRELFISRDKIEKWNRKKNDVLFSTDEKINLKALSLGEIINFTFVIKNGEFVVTKINLPAMKKGH